MHASEFQRLHLPAGVNSQTRKSITEVISSVTKPNDRVVVCSSILDDGLNPAEIAAAVEKSGGKVLLWAKDQRWKTLLRMAFESRAKTVVGSAESLLALAKLSKFSHIPLNVFYAIVLDAEGKQWMLDSIATELDCRVFSGMGEEWESQSPASSNREYRVTDLMKWESVLDCKAYRSVSGLVMEVVCLQGGELPKLPSCAKMILRNWNPDLDVPMPLNVAESAIPVM